MAKRTLFTPGTPRPELTTSAPIPEWIYQDILPQNTDPLPMAPEQIGSVPHTTLFSHHTPQNIGRDVRIVYDDEHRAGHTETVPWARDREKPITTLIRRRIRDRCFHEYEPPQNWAPAKKPIALPLLKSPGDLDVVRHRAWIEQHQWLLRAEKLWNPQARKDDAIERATARKKYIDENAIIIPDDALLPQPHTMEPDMRRGTDDYSETEKELITAMIKLQLLYPILNPSTFHRKIQVLSHNQWSPLLPVRRPTHPTGRFLVPGTQTLSVPIYLPWRDIMRPLDAERIIDNDPRVSIYCGAIASENGEVVASELRFDFDIQDWTYQESAGQCEATRIECTCIPDKPKGTTCVVCTTKTWYWVTLLPTILNETAGINQTMVYASGNRGYHVWVYDNHCRALSQRERGFVAKRISPQGFNLWLDQTIEAGTSNLRHLKKAIWFTAKRLENFINLVNLDPTDPDYNILESYDNITEPTIEEIKHLYDGIYMLPDMQVTESTVRTLRCPFAFNNKTGFRVLPIPYPRLFSLTEYEQGWERYSFVPPRTTTLFHVEIEFLTNMLREHPLTATTTSIGQQQITFHTPTQMTMEQPSGTPQDVLTWLKNYNDQQRREHQLDNKPWTNQSIVAAPSMRGTTISWRLAPKYCPYAGHTHTSNNPYVTKNNLTGAVYIWCGCAQGQAHQEALTGRPARRPPPRNVPVEIPFSSSSSSDSDADSL